LAQADGFDLSDKLGHQFIDTWLEESQATCNPDWPDQVWVFFLVDWFNLLASL